MDLFFAFVLGIVSCKSDHTMETYTFDNFPPYGKQIHITLFKNVSNAAEIRKRLIAASTMEGKEGDKAREEVDFGFVDASMVGWRTRPDSCYLLLGYGNHMLVGSRVRADVVRCPGGHACTYCAIGLEPDEQIVSRQHLLSALYSTILTTLPQLHPSTDPIPNSSSTPIDPTSTSTSNPDPSPSPLTPQTRSHNLHSELLLSLSPSNNISDALRRFGVSDSTRSLVVVRIGDGGGDGPGDGPRTSAEKRDGPTQIPHVQHVWEDIARLVVGEVARVSELDEGKMTDWGKVDKVSFGWTENACDHNFGRVCWSSSSCARRTHSYEDYADFRHTKLPR